MADPAPGSQEGQENQQKAALSRLLWPWRIDTDEVPVLLTGAFFWGLIIGVIVGATTGG